MPAPFRLFRRVCGINYFRQHRFFGEPQMNSSKIRIKLGAIEVEYEGSESFLKEELPSLLSVVSELYLRSNSSGLDERSSANRDQAGTANSAGLQATKLRIEMTTGSIAARLQVKSGPELVMAAAARLGIVEELNSFSRKRLTEQMRSATAYFKPSYASNLSGLLNSLLKDGKLNEPSKDHFALTAASEQELRSRIA